MEDKTLRMEEVNLEKEKIVLGMLPYWTPLIPPQGIGCLKSFLQKYGYRVKCLDLNDEERFKEIYNSYFNRLKEYVPEGKWGNFYNVGHDVLQNHMMAHISHKDEIRYIELVKILVYNTYYTHIDDKQVCELNNILDDFYESLKKYYTELLYTEQPDVLGFSVLKGNIPASIFAARVAKHLKPDIRIVMGGGAFADFHEIGSPNFESLLEVTKDCVDNFFVTAQGELLFLKYLQGELPKDKRVYTRDDINMQVLDFPSVDIADLSDFNTINYPYIAATGSVSCPNRCSFCNASKFFGTYRQKEAKQIVDEMIRLYHRYKSQLFFMTDSLLNFVVTDLATEFINAGIVLYYDCYFRVDEKSANINNTLLWRRGGLYRTRLGVESGSQKVLDLMHKNITVDQTRATISALANAGIKTTAYCVIGHPEETEEDFQMTLDLMEELKNDIWQAECNPFYYHYSGQFDSDGWSDKRERLYPESAKDMLVFDTWTLNCEPLREERYRRMHRFIEHCKDLGIPNPYTAAEIYEADERWKRLHKNAVPSVWEFKSFGNYVEDVKKVKKYFEAENVLNNDEGFDF